MAHLAFAHLAYVVDHYGRCPANPRHILHGMMSLRRDVTEREVAKWIGEWEREGLIQRYEADGLELLQVLTFDRFQPDARDYRTRNAIPERLPPPQDYTPPAAMRSRKLREPSAQPAEKLTASCGKINRKLRKNSPQVAEKLGAENENENENDNDNDTPLPPANGGVVCVLPAAQRIPPEVAARAEQLVGRPLSTAEQALLTRFVHADSYPVAWILEALDDAETGGHRRVHYAKGILERYRDEGGPRQRAACASRNSRTEEPWVDDLPWFEGHEP